jgi:uncharacterized protein YraI
MNRITLLLVILLASACSAPPSPVAMPTPSSTHPPSASPTPALTATPPPPATTATPWPVEGTLTVRVNVRSGPGTEFESLGMLDPGQKVLISAQDQAGQWYQFYYPSAPGGRAWVIAQFVQIPAGTQVPREATPTPTGPVGRVLQRLNVRSGPGLAFDTLGMLEPEALVSLTGKNSTASWFQIDYPAGPAGRGWVTAQYIQADAAGLPVLDDYGTPAANAAGGPTPIPVTPTPTVGPAFLDQDSSAEPAVRVLFSASGTRQFTYSSQVSAPQGDPGDWLEFTPYSVTGTDARLAFSLACSGNGGLSVELSRDGSLLSNWGTLSCGDLDKLITLPAGQAYELHLSPLPGDGLQLVDYVLTIQNKP